MTLDDLAKVAMAATQGEWIVSRNKDKDATDIWSPKKSARDEDDEEYNTVCSFGSSHLYGYGCDSHVEKDAAHIAAFSPPVALALVALAQAVVSARRDDRCTQGECGNPVCQAACSLTLALEGNADGE